MDNRRTLHFSLLGFLVLLINNGPLQAAPAEVANSNEYQNDTTIEPDTRIVGGKEACEGQFPWQVFIIMDQVALCGGSVIAENWILSAGHCTYKVLRFEVTVGTLYRTAPPPGVNEPNRKTIVSRRGVPNPLYKPDPFEISNDVGLIELPEALKYNADVQPIPLATSTPEYLNLDFKTARISGWGKTWDFGSASLVLRYTDLEIRPGAECTAKYGDKKMDQKICCSTKGGHSTCNGDSGGPLIYRSSDDDVYHEIGIVSYGGRTCVLGYPVVFTRVTSFLDFIYATTGLTGEVPQ